MPTLMVMRHAKSDWDAAYAADISRPLNDRGIRSARLMGRLVARLDHVPELVISSPAVRARTTAELAIESGGWRCPLTIEEALYGGGVHAVVDVITGLGEQERVMVVGHQPTWSQLVRHLTGESAEMKTATIAVVELGHTWSRVTEGSGVLTSVEHPRTYFGGELDL